MYGEEQGQRDRGRGGGRLPFESGCSDFWWWLASFSGNEKICFIDAPANNDIDCSAFSQAQGEGGGVGGGVGTVAAGGGCCTANGLSGASLLLLLLQSTSQLAALIK